MTVAHHSHLVSDALSASGRPPQLMTEVSWWRVSDEPPKLPLQPMQSLLLVSVDSVQGLPEWAQNNFFSVRATLPGVAIQQTHEQQAVDQGYGGVYRGEEDPVKLQRMREKMTYLMGMRGPAGVHGVQEMDIERIAWLLDLSIEEA